MADVTLIRAGRWALSRPMQDASGAWTTFAADQHLAEIVENYFPPQAADGTPLVDAVLVRGIRPLVAPSDGNTVLFPRDMADLADVEMSELTAQQRQNWRTILETWLTGYTFTDYDGTERVITPFTEVTATYTGATTLKQIARDVFKHFCHTVSRTRAPLQSDHNTESLDNFSTDPFSAPRWTNERGTAVWDSTNSEMDMDQLVGRNAVRYSVTGPGSEEHEAQATFIAGASTQVPGGGGCRFDNAGVDDWYEAQINSGTDDVIVRRVVAGSATNLVTFTDGLIHASGEWITIRMAAIGAVGANVVINLWFQNHGSTKPSDPGWIGVDDTPNQTTTDTAVARLDNSSHVHCGMACGGSGVDYDTRHSFYKQRAISDRSGGAFTLDAQSGAYTTTGSAAGLRVGRRLSAESGTFTTTGTDATLTHGQAEQLPGGGIGSDVIGTVPIGDITAEEGAYVLVAESGSFVTTGSAAALRSARRLAAESGTFNQTGTAAALRWGHRIIAESGTFQLIGTSAALRAARRMTALAGSFATTGSAAVLRTGRRLTASAGVFTTTGTDANLVHAGNKIMAAESGSFVTTGTAAVLRAGRSLTALAGSFSTTGTPAVLRRAARLLALPGGFVTTGTTAVLSVGRRVTAQSGVFTTTGQPASLRAGRVLMALPGAFFTTGSDAQLIRGGVEVGYIELAASYEPMLTFQANYEPSMTLGGTFEPALTLEASIDID
jgi:hypothetical protein